MSTQYQQRNRVDYYNTHEHENTHQLKRDGSSSGRQPLQAKDFNTESNSQNVPSKVRPQVTKPSSSSKQKVDNDTAPLEIEELRRKPNGEGHTVHRYLRGKILGKGGFAKVYMCTSMDTNKTYAVKIVPKANLKKTRARQKVRSISIENIFFGIYVNLILCHSTY